jgi:hypothetical protein
MYIGTLLYVVMNYGKGKKVGTKGYNCRKLLYQSMSSACRHQAENDAGGRRQFRESQPATCGKIEWSEIARDGLHAYSVYRPWVSLMLHPHKNLNFFYGFPA